MAEMETGVRKSLGSPEADWAREYERSLIPAGSRFPRKGDVYESIEAVEVNYLTSWAAPFTGGATVTLPAGHRVVISGDSRDPQPIAVYADAVDYKALEELVVPAVDRQAKKYTGFYFSISTVALNSKFRLVREGAT